MKQLKVDLRKKRQPRTYHSLAELGRAMGLSAKKDRPQAVRKCFRCGATMKYIPGTNVFVCPGATDSPCDQFALTAK